MLITFRAQRVKKNQRRQHPASGAFFCLLLHRGGEKQALPESRRIPTSGLFHLATLVKLVFRVRSFVY